MTSPRFRMTLTTTELKALVKLAIGRERVTEGELVRELERHVGENVVAVSGYAASLFIDSGLVDLGDFERTWALSEANVCLFEARSAEQAERVRVLKNSGRDKEGRMVELGFNGRVSNMDALVALLWLNEASPDERGDLEPWSGPSSELLRHVSPQG